MTVPLRRYARGNELDENENSAGNLPESKIKGNSRVVIDDAAVNGESTDGGNSLDGVFLDASENGAADTVTGIESDMNGSGIDLHDATANCGSSGSFNLWSSLVFGTSKAGATMSPVLHSAIPEFISSFLHLSAGRPASILAGEYFPLAPCAIGLLYNKLYRFTSIS